MNGLGTFSRHNLSSVGSISKIFRFSKSLERDLSNGTIDVCIWEMTEFVNFGQIPWIIKAKNEKYGLKIDYWFKHAIL